MLFSPIEVKLADKFFSARHGVKHVDRVVVYNIIGGFDKVSGGIVPDNEPLVNIGFKQLFVHRMPHGMADINFRYPVPESGVIEFDIRKHVS
jgi:hypothetical protein